MLYRWVLYVHVASVLLFVGLHGVSAWVSWPIQRERDPMRIRWLVSLSTSASTLVYPSLLLILATGIWAGFLGSWWGRRWIWAAILVLLVLVGAMGALSQSYRRLRLAAGVPMPGRRPEPAEPTGSEAIIAAASATKPAALAVIGVVGLLVLLWLMLFKPF